MSIQNSGFIFDGAFDSWDDLNLMVGHVTKALAPQMVNSRQDVPAMYGDISLGVSLSNRVFSIPVTIISETATEYNENLHNIASALIRSNEDSDSEYELVFKDEPEVTYYGAFTELPTPTFLTDQGWDSTTTLTFICSDPKGYLDQESVTVDDEEFDFTPDGTGETLPIFRITPKNDVSQIGVAYGSDDDKYINIGFDQSIDSDGNVADNEPILVDDPCNTLGTWTKVTTPTFPIEGKIDGSYMSNEASISVYRKDNSVKNSYDYGDPAKHGSELYGPMLLHQGLPRIVKDFEVTFRMRHDKNYPRAQSKDEVYGVTGTGTSAFRAYMQDGSQGASTEMRVFLGTPGHEVEAYHGWHGYKNAKDKKVSVTLTKQKKTIKKSTKGKKGKAKTVVSYYPKKVLLNDYEATSYYNHGFTQTRIRKIGLKVWLSIWECDVKTGKAGKYIVKNKVINLKPDQDFDLQTIAWHATKKNITEDSINPKTKKPNKIYNYGWNSITSYTVKQILNGGNTEENHIIAHAGQTIVIDCERQETTLISGGNVSSLEKKVSIGTTYPALQGGVTETLAFSPGIDAADIEIDYRPTYM